MSVELGELSLNRDFVARVRERNRGLVLMVGAGASIASGLPNWTELNARLLSNFLREKHPDIDFDPRSLEVAAHVFQERFGREAAVDLVRNELRNDYFDALREALYPIEPTPSSVHYEAAAFAFRPGRPRPLYTFNFDGLLEEAMRELGSRHSVARARRQPSEIFHLHGKLLRNGEREGAIVLSERDFHHVANEPALEDELASVFTRNDVLLVGLSLADPRLRRLLLSRRRMGSSRNKVFLLREVSRGEPGADISTRLSHGLVRRYEPAFWDDWDLDVGFLSRRELLPVHLRCIRLGESLSDWVKLGVRFLERASTDFHRLEEPSVQRGIRLLLHDVRGLVEDRFGASRDEGIGIGAFVPRGDGTLKLAFRLRARETPDSPPDGDSRRRRTLRIASWDRIQGAAGHAFAYGVPLMASKGSGFINANFPEAMQREWRATRSFRTILCIPVLDSRNWVPIGVVYLTSNQESPFWERLGRDDHRDLESMLGSTFRAALRYP